MKKQICETLCDIMGDYPRTTLFSIVSIIVLILAVIIEWMGMTNGITLVLCLGVLFFVAIMLLSVED